jgi:hypothetical protein
MHERSIFEEDVESVITHGEVIKEYPNDTPYPSYLVLLIIEEKPIHVVYSIYNTRDEKQYYIITVYNPSLDEWHGDYKTRRVEI